jgi:hypothetical protein
MAPLSTYCNLILQSIICLCEKPNFTKKIRFLIIIAFPMTKKTQNQKKRTQKLWPMILFKPINALNTDLEVI